MSKNIQIPQTLLLDVYKLITALQNYELDIYTKELSNSIEGQIEAKLDALKRREAFTKYKTSLPNSDERENARKEYLEISEIQSNWQTSKERPI